MLKKLRKTILPGVFVWKVELRLPTRRVHTHVELSEPAAQQMYASLLAERSHDRVGMAYAQPKAKMTVADACDKYEHELLMTGKNTQHISDVHFSLSLLRKAAGDEYPAELLNREHVRLWRDARAAYIHKRGKKQTVFKQAGPRTTNKGLAHLSAFFGWCCEENLLEVNPAANFKRTKEITPLMKSLSWMDFSTFADAAWKHRGDFGLLLEILGETGARINEVLRANCGDVNPLQRTWTKTVKPGKIHVMDAGPWTLAAAADRAAAAPLIPIARHLRQRRTGKAASRWTYSMVKKAFKAVLKATKLKRFVPHAIRHGRACWDLIDGKTVHQVKEKLGHSSVMITEHYSKAAELLRREEPPGVVHSRPLPEGQSVWRLCDKTHSRTQTSAHKRTQTRTTKKPVPPMINQAKTDLHRSTEG